MVGSAEAQEFSTSCTTFTQVPNEPQSFGQHLLELMFSGVLQTAGNGAQAVGSTANSNKTLIVAVESPGKYELHW